MKKFLISLFSLISIICFIYFKSPSVSAKETWSYQDCIEIKNFIEKNFDKFVAEYNANNQVNLKASSIEYSSIINLIEDKNYGIYLDFNDSNGYCVMTGDCTIYELEVEGDYETLRSTKELSYSYVDGFVFLDENGLFQKLIKKTNSSIDELNPVLYPGQSEAGDGKIDYRNINEYIDARYPDYQYEGENINLRDSFTFNLQTHLSYFNQYKCNADGTIYNDYRTYTAEGNCSLTAMTNLLTFWSKKGFVNNIDYDSRTNICSSIKTHPQFEEWGSGKILYSSSGENLGLVTHDPKNDLNPLKNSNFGKYDYYCWIINQKNFLFVMKNLYTNIREYAVEKFNYTPISGLYDYQSKEVLCGVAQRYYNQSISINSTDSLSSALDSIDAGKAVYLGINGSSTYQDHAVVLLGYQKYSYTTGWWIFKKTHYVYFYEIADGWNGKSSYFDPNTDANPTMNYLILS